MAARWAACCWPAPRSPRCGCCASSAAFAERQGRERDFTTARALAALTLPMLWVGSLLAWDRQGHLLAGAMALALPLAWATHLWVLRRQDEDGCALLNTPRHIAGAWTLLLSAGIEAGGWLELWQPGQDLWRWLAWIAVWGLAARTVQAALSASDADERWPWAVAPDAWRQALLRPVGLLLLLTVVALQFAHDGSSALPYLPLASALDIASVAALGWLARSRLLPGPAVGAAGLLWVSALAARGVHHLAGVAWSAAAMFQSTLLQATLSLTWTVSALALMVWATRRGARTLWFAGFALLAEVGAKMLMVDLAGAGTAEWTGSLLGIGVLILAASYLAPVPPGHAGPAGHGRPDGPHAGRDEEAAAGDPPHDGTADGGARCGPRRRRRDQGMHLAGGRQAHRPLHRPARRQLPLYRREPDRELGEGQGGLYRSEGQRRLRGPDRKSDPLPHENEHAVGPGVDEIGYRRPLAGRRLR